jgi:hypothetical protein
MSNQEPGSQSKIPDQSTDGGRGRSLAAKGAAWVSSKEVETSCSEAKAVVEGHHMFIEGIFDCT